MTTLLRVLLLSCISPSGVVAFNCRIGSPDRSQTRGLPLTSNTLYSVEGSYRPGRAVGHRSMVSLHAACAAPTGVLRNYLAAARTALSPYLLCSDPSAGLAGPQDSSQELVLVLGNEACDLDSMVSATLLAMAASHGILDSSCGGLSSAIIAPVMNIPRAEYSLRQVMLAP